MRPQKTRHIESPPLWERYLPEGRRQAAEVTLGLDMYEALRLVDAEGLPQDAAAERMGVSTPTLCRLLGEARRRVATALRDGWALRCEGGNVKVGPGGRHGQGGPWRHGRQAGPERRAGDLRTEGPAAGCGRHARGTGPCRQDREESGSC